MIVTYLSMMLGLTGEYACEFVDKGGAALAPPGGAGGGAEVAFREGILWGTQPDGRALPVSPRYWIVRRPGSYELDDCPVSVLHSALLSMRCTQVGGTVAHLGASTRMYNPRETKGLLHD
ncbi:MAG: hypothetical protein HQ453_10870 [Actinobacteria bacterium]|nr:hypothetical protein [Actinomycetota bacterium]